MMWTQFTFISVFSTRTTHSSSSSLSILFLYPLYLLIQKFFLSFLPFSVSKLFSWFQKEEHCLIIINFILSPLSSYPINGLYMSWYGSRGKEYCGETFARFREKEEMNLFHTRTLLFFSHFVGIIPFLRTASWEEGWEKRVKNWFLTFSVKKNGITE